MSNLHALTARPARLSEKLRSAIRLRVERGLTIAEACKQAGMSEAGYHKAMQRAAVQDYVAEVQLRFVAGVDARRAALRGQALEVARELMLHAKSEAIRARMAEFLAGDGKAPTVAVHIDARTERGYEFVRPGQRVVEVEQGAIPTIE